MAEGHHLDLALTHAFKMQDTNAQGMTVSRGHQLAAALQPPLLSP